MTAKSRRSFPNTSTAVAATLAARATVRGRNLNDRMRVAVIGMGGRPAAHTVSLTGVPSSNSPVPVTGELNTRWPRR